MAHAARLWAHTWPKHTEFDVLVVDPPWPYSSRGFHTSVPYAVLTLAELHAMPVAKLAKPKAALLLWTTGPFMPHALELMRTWGFAYKTVFIDWYKVYADGSSRVGPGYYTRPCHEFLLLGTRGSVLSLKQSCSVSQHVQALVHKHSEKPAAAYEAIEAFFGPACKKIELFARKPRYGWAVWGNQLFEHVYYIDLSFL